MPDEIKATKGALLEAADLRMIAAAGGEKFPYAPSLLSAAQTIERLRGAIRDIAVAMNEKRQEHPGLDAQSAWRSVSAGEVLARSRIARI